ncbi:GtrA family protein [Bacillus wiedmannii]|uniref:GtrA family protein n=1 Tax=Bacillus wiedmannii TaxID=1890302 RepID=UPI0039FD27FA
MKVFNKQVIRFIIVGCTNTLNYYIFYLLLSRLIELNYLSAHIIATVIGIIGSFFLNTYFTYKTKPTLKKCLQFPLTYAVNIAVTTIGIYILVDLVGLNEIISPFLASLTAIPFTYLLSKKILVTKIERIV